MGNIDKILTLFYKKLLWGSSELLKILGWY